MAPMAFTCCSLLLYYALMGCLARDTLFFINSHTLDESSGDTLVSAERRFELGFFSPSDNSSNGKYLGIWYHNLTYRTVVWVANRDKPLRNSSGILGFGYDGNLQVIDESGKLYWSTDINKRGVIRMNYTEAKLMDSGNLVLFYNQSGPSEPLWQSFDNPVDTLLPGMKLSSEPAGSSSISLNSWMGEGNPVLGNFNFSEQVQNEIKQFVIQSNNNKIVPRWKSTDETELFRSTETDAQLNLISGILSNLTTSQDSNKANWRLVMNSTGDVQYWILDAQQWILKSWAPRDNCALGNVCGTFGICNVNNKIPCKCLPGFTPSYQEKWDGRYFSDGCKRNEDIGATNDTFLALSNMRVRKSDSSVTLDEEQCREQCLNTQQCQAYGIENEDAQSDQSCWIWTWYLDYLQEDYNGGAKKLFVRVATSSIKSTARSCDPCGTNLIPYPLSTGSACGEPGYDGFHCDTSSGKTSFTALARANIVTRIEQNRTFFVQIKEADDCSNRNRSVVDNKLHLNQTLPFPFKLIKATYWCDSKMGTYGYNDSIGMEELEIRWKAPPEPTCTSLFDCKDWPNSNCKLSKGGQKQCICNTHFKWNSSALSCTEVSAKHTSISLIVGASIGVAAVVLSSSILFCWLFRRKLSKRQEGREKFQNEALMQDTENRIKELIDSQHFTEEDGKRIDAHFFDFNSILAATDNFSDANKLGQGGFGPVYKGKFPGGQEIAIKRLSTVSGQGLEEFKNEVVLIAKLQHRNLVRLLGYCLKGDEKILLYEYMHNKSLDIFLFDSQLCTLLTWEKRFDIILGVARGLLYLHQDSRLRIVHRDLKTSNILLDEEMNPKISDFGLAKMVVGKQNEGSTERVIGTFGYMSPEYRLEGMFSVKSDVFSFGVVVLEILSGRKNASYFNLLNYAWRLWKEDKTMELMEGTLDESCNRSKFLNCVNVALLCIEENPADRPTMSSVVVLLSSETETLPAPKKPACITRGSQHSPEPSSASSSKQDASRNTLTVSEEGR